MVMEAEKSHNLLSARWRPRNVGGIIQSKSDGLRARGLMLLNPSPGVEEDEMTCPISSSEAEKGAYFSFLFLFHSGLQ